MMAERPRIQFAFGGTPTAVTEAPTTNTPAYTRIYVVHVAVVFVH